MFTTFFNISIIFWLVRIFLSFNYPSSINHHIKWCLSWIFLILEWKIEFFTRWIALYLSPHNLLSSSLPNSFINLYNHIIYLLVFLVATYFAFVVKRETTFFSFQIQITIILTIIKNITYCSSQTNNITLHV